MMENNLRAEDPPGKRRRLAIVITAFVATVVTYFKCQDIVTSSLYTPLPRIEPLFDTSGIIHSTEYLISVARQVEINLIGQMVAADEFSADRRYKSEAQFWDVYTGDTTDFYKDFRMAKSTFNQIVKDCIPYLYDRPTTSLKSVRHRYLRSKVTIGTLIRYLATQSDQHTLAKEFGIRQPAISRRIDRAVRAVLSVYHFDGCAKPKIRFPLEDGRRESAEWFFRKTKIPYILGSIDGSIIKISAPFSTNYMPSEFFCGRKHTYSLNLMAICDHKKRFIFADCRWPGTTNDLGAVSRSRFLSNLLISRDNLLFPRPWMILADGGFHKRSCFIAPDFPGNNFLTNLFNKYISRGRVIVENCFGLLKMKWRRLHQHSIAEKTEIIPEIVLCACIFHNICIDAGDVDATEALAIRSPEELAEERLELNAGYSRTIGIENLNMMTNAAALVLEYKVKQLAIFDMFVDIYNNIEMTLSALRAVHGPDAFSFEGVVDDI